MVDWHDPSSLWEICDQFRPSIIVHTAGLTDVDQCETCPEAAQYANSELAGMVAQCAKRVNCKLIHISTDHLYSGTGAMLDERAPPEPVNEYARTKLDGELRVREALESSLIIRTNFYGWGPTWRPSFTDWLFNQLEKGEHIQAFSDIHFTPILITDLVEASMKLALKGVSGIVNVCGGERVSKFEFCRKAARIFGYDPSLIAPISIGDRILKAHRPLDMSLSTGLATALLGHAMPSVDDGLWALKREQDQGYGNLIRNILPA